MESKLGSRETRIVDYRDYSEMWGHALPTISCTAFFFLRARYAAPLATYGWTTFRPSSHGCTGYTRSIS